MINLQGLKTTDLFGYFPSGIIDQTNDEELKAKHKAFKQCIHTEQLFDNSLITPNLELVVRASGERVTATDYHLTEIGELNGGVEVIKQDGKKDYYYANQLMKL